MSAPSHSLFRSVAGHTVLALHSSGSKGGQWRAYGQALPAAVRLHTPDLLGYAATEAFRPGMALTLDDEGDRLMPLLGQVDAPVHLVGHSYGGAVGLQLALRRPQRIRSLTLYEPVHFALLRQAAPGAWQEVQALAGDIAGHLEAHAPDPAAERLVDY